MNKTKKYMLIIVILILTISISGCWDRRNFEKYTLIKGIAVDKTKNGRVKLSIQVVTPAKSNGNNNKNQLSGSCCLATATGFNIYDANRNMIKIIGKKPFYGHSEVIIISEDIAREGIAPYLDYFIREPEIRGRSSIAISRGKADQILKTSHILEPITSAGIRYMIDGLSVTGTVITIDLIHFLKQFFNDTTDPVASALEVKKSSSSDSQKQTQKIPYTNGGAMFREDKLVDWLTRREARGLNWVLKPQDVRGPVLVYPPNEPKSSKIAVEITRSTSRLKAKIIEGRFTVDLYVNTEGFIIEDTSSKYNIINEKNLKQLDKRYAQVIRNEIYNTLKKSQKYGRYLRFR